MTERETKQILAVLEAAYPNFYRGETPDGLKRAVQLWSAMFADDAYSDVSAAVSALIASRSETFPPVIGEVKQKMYAIHHQDDQTGAEAWALVRRAIGRSSYYAREEWAKLPDDVRKVVTPEQLRSWAMDEDFNEPVVMSHFIRAYRERSERERDYSLMPSATRAALEQSEQKRLEG